MKQIAVFCGSNSGDMPDYARDAEALGNALLDYDMDLIFGGANVGLMRYIADVILEGGGQAIGVMPRILAEKQAHPNLSHLHIVETMNERKNIICSLADGFITLPGGFGTLDELFEVLALAQLGIHTKPVGLLNTGGYFTRLLDFLDHASRQGFTDKEDRDLILEDSNPGRLLKRMKACDRNVSGTSHH